MNKQKIIIELIKEVKKLRKRVKTLEEEHEMIMKILDNLIEKK